MNKFSHCLFLGTLLLSCNPSEKEKATEIITIEEKALIPEGVTIGNSGEIYLSNIYSKNIIRTNPDGTDPRVIKTKYTGVFSGVGITQKNGNLYALGNTNDQSIFQIIDVETKRLTESYLAWDTATTFLNDLAVAYDGTVYITDTNLHRIYTLQNDFLAVFLESEEIQYPNGIALSDDEKTLFIASSTKGIRIYRFESGEFVNDVDTAGTSAGIDGLKFYKNSLIGIQNVARNIEEHTITRFYLNDEQTQIIRVDTLFVNHPSFNVPTTFDIKDDWAYCLSNSQLDNLDQEKMQIIDPDALTNTFILKFKLK